MPLPQTVPVWTTLAAFVAVSIVVICVPGPDTALTVRNALVGGRRCGVWTAAGVSTGQAVWTLATSLGVAGLLRTSEPAFLAVKVAGVAYLLYLGVQSLRAAWTDRGHNAAPTGGAPRLTPIRAWRQGAISNLANPKMAAFFMSLLPQFAPDGPASFAVMAALGFLFCVLTFAWLAAYSLAVARARRLLTRPRVRRTLDGLAGGVLIAFGLRLATEH